MGRTLDDVAWPWRTRRLVLRRPTTHDAPTIFSYRSDPAVGRWVGRQPSELQQFLVDFPKWSSNKVVATWDEVLIGDGMITIQDAWAQVEVAEQARGTKAELGWCLAPAFQRRGFGRELVTALLDITFGPLGLRRVIAGCFAENEPSWRLMEAVGMRREEYAVADTLHRDGTWRDGMTYAMLARDWEGQGRR